jgi:NAD(P)-dependent dehydrogenase (short-subunit alcohol dehydrogenase family)
MVGRRLVVTGAARGIGEKVARLAAARAARLAVLGLEPDRLRNLADELRPTASWREADVCDGAALRLNGGRSPRLSPRPATGILPAPRGELVPLVRSSRHLLPAVV